MKEKLKQTKGITLIALIITIIILLILAVVSIRLVINGGIIDKSKQATTAYGTAEEQEQIKLAYADYQMAKAQGETNPTLTVAGATVTGDETTGWTITFDKTGNVYTLSSDGKTITPQTNSGDQSTTTVTDASKEEMLSKTENTIAYDEYKNKIVVPAGFKILINDDTNNATHVTEGIVITDGVNEFVWIPVGNIKTSTADTTGTPITLGRYVFNADGTINEELSQTAPEGQLKTSSTATNYYVEGTSNGNATAKAIDTFITSANDKGGYYIGRYEARTTTERIGTGNTLTAVTENKTDYVYRYVTQLQASERCQSMYTNQPFESDLINSYAWDTAIVFIQTFGGNNTYSRSARISSDFSNIGTTEDKISNIYDMAGNCYEWTTEMYSGSGIPQGPCVFRGGGYDSSSYYVGSRDSRSKTTGGQIFSFRPILYM